MGNRPVPKLATAARSPREYLPCFSESNSVTCATNYATSTVVTVVCPVSGGSFQFGGCSENSCSANSGDRTGYTLANPQATTVSGLGTLLCAPNYAGTAVVKCAPSGSAFQMSGCAENVCVVGSGGT